MRYTQTNLKLTSLFVLAFLCLNAGGILCLTYCGQAVKARAAASHMQHAGSACPHHPQPPAETANDHTASAGAVSCCTMPVGMIAPAPLQTQTRIEAPAAIVVSVEKVAFERPLLGLTRQIADHPYRPPPNDRRGDRVRNQVFRI